MNAFEQMYRYLVRDVEATMQRQLTDSQKQGIWNSGSLMFLEAVANGFYFAQTNVERETWLVEIDGFTRGQEVPGRPEDV